MWTWYFIEPYWRLPKGNFGLYNHCSKPHCLSTFWHHANYCKLVISASLALTGENIQCWLFFILIHATSLKHSDWLTCLQICSLIRRCYLLLNTSFNSWEELRVFVLGLFVALWANTNIGYFWFSVVDLVTFKNKSNKYIYIFFY